MENNGLEDLEGKLDRRNERRPSKKWSITESGEKRVHLWKPTNMSSESQNLETRTEKGLHNYFSSSSTVRNSEFAESAPPLIHSASMPKISKPRTTITNLGKFGFGKLSLSSLLKRLLPKPASIDETPRSFNETLMRRFIKVSIADFNQPISEDQSIPRNVCLANDKQTLATYKLLSKSYCSIEEIENEKPTRRRSVSQHRNLYNKERGIHRSSTMDLVSQEFKVPVSTESPIFHVTNSDPHSHPIIESHTVFIKNDVSSSFINDEGNKAISQGQMNQFYFLENIGEGSYGRVVRAYDSISGSYHACKIISKSRLLKKFRFSAATLKEKIMIIKHEVEVLKKVTPHPYIARLFEVVDDKRDENLYLVFELCERGPVMKIQVGQVQPYFTEDEARGYFRDVLLGLEYLHSRGIIHCDLKPDNIFVNAAGTARIGDFGISMILEDHRQMIEINNTSPLFTAPCAILHPKFHGRPADIWAFGITLYCFVHGHCPFEDESILALFARIKKDTPVFKRTLSAPLKDLLQRMMTKSPMTRITIEGIRKHPWTTKLNQIPLISEVRNCLANTDTSWRKCKVPGSAFNSDARSIENFSTAQGQSQISRQRCGGNVEQCLNNPATKIQAAMRGYLRVCELLVECAMLRQTIIEKDQLIFQYSLIISNKESKISNFLNEHGRALEMPTSVASSLKSSSTLFQNTDSLNDEFCGLNIDSVSESVKSSQDDVAFPIVNGAKSPRNWKKTLKHSASMDFQSNNSDCAKPATVDMLRNIWSVQPVPLQSKNQTSKSLVRQPLKSKSTGSLLGGEQLSSESCSAGKISSPLNGFNMTIASRPLPSTQNADPKEIKSSYKALVEKIVKTNDQPCSIFLQQRLKVEGPNVKACILDAVHSQLLPLMKNRFGNFLVQCCLDYGTQEQFNSLCIKMRGHVVQLSCDRFGCHVMQKVIQKVHEDMKIDLISEMFPAVLETFTHRFACHVWQRIFDVKWALVNPNIISNVQKSLVGKWAAISNDENGSLIVQCIFEHCSQSDTGLITGEILECIFDIAKGQWGNWVIQHLLEHGTVAEQSKIIQVIFDNAFSMSIDQYASKVVEKCVKFASKKDLYRFVDQITVKHSDREFPYILSMMNNQFGNYVVQSVLMQTELREREKCVILLKPYLPTLRGSKTGQRVASLCEKYLRTK